MADLVEPRGWCVCSCVRLCASHLGLAKAGGHQASGVNIQVPLLPALVVRVQGRDPAVQGADDHQRPAHAGDPR